MSTLAGGLAPGAQAATLQRARVAAASCVRAQGIDIPDPGIGRGSVLALLRILGSYPSVKVQAAEKACATQIRRAFPNATGLTPGQRAVRQREGLAFSACMRSHGIAFPDQAAMRATPLLTRRLSARSISTARPSRAPRKHARRSR